MDIQKINMDKRWVKFLLHFSSWAGIFSFVIFAAPLDVFAAPLSIHIKLGSHFLLVLGFYYLNTMVFIPKLLFNHRVFWYVLILLASLAFIYFINIKLTDALDLKNQLSSIIDEGIDLNAKGRGRWIVKEKAVVVTPAIAFLYGVILSSVGRALRHDKDKEEIVKEKLIAELAFLKNQINPHFFFNTLNNIYSFVGSNPEKARNTIHQLSKLMRYMLYETDKDRIAIAKEVEFLEEYIKLMQLRVSSDVKVEFEKNNLSNYLEVPPLVFIPFIENAFKHGVSYELESKIKIKLSTSSESISFEVENPIHKKQETGEPGGIGLTNIQKRLALLYPKQNYSLEIKEEEAIYYVKLRLPVDA